MDHFKNVTKSSETRKQKRERSVNYTQEETELLMSLAEVNKCIIENKKSDATTWHDKERAWKDIEKKFNSSSGSVFRDHKHLKIKYEAMKKDARKKIAVVRTEPYNTGGGTSTSPVLSPVEQNVNNMTRESDEGNENCYDSDFVIPSKPKEKRFDKLIEAKIEITQLQKKIIMEELEQKQIQRKCLEDELVHKKAMRDLEIKHMLLKIEILKKDLENK